MRWAASSSARRTTQSATTASSFRLRWIQTLGHAERTIESLLGSKNLPRPTGTGVGVVRASQNLGRHYYRHLYKLGVDLTGLDVVVDAAFGAAFAVAPYALRKLGATVTELHCENDS